MIQDRVSDGSGDYRSDSMSRRRLIQLGTAGATLSLAGCLGGDDEDDDGGDDDSATGGGGDGELLRDTLTMPSIRGDTLNDTIFNTLHPGSSVRYLARILWPVNMLWSAPDTEWFPNTFAEWDLPEAVEPGDEGTLTLQDGIYWHNGDQLTAEDAVKGLDLAVLDSPSGLPWLADREEAFEVVDELSFTINFDTAYSQELVLEDLATFNSEANLGLGSPAFAEFHERLEDSTTDEEDQEILIDATEFQMEDPMGYGPFEVHQITTNYIEFEVNNDNWPLTDFNWDYLRLQEVADDYRSATASQTIDRAINEQFFYEDDVEYEGAQIREYDSDRGNGICFDTRRDDLYFDNRRVRQAIAWAVSRWDIAEDMAPHVDKREELLNIMYPSTVSGMNDDTLELYLGDWWEENLPDYDGHESNTEMAAEILEEEGFTMEDDWWHTPDGERWSFAIESYAEWEWHDVPQSIVGQLRAFGIDIELRTIESGEFWGTGFGDEEFEVMMTAWGSHSPSLPLHPALIADNFLTYEGVMSREQHKQTDHESWDYDEPIYFEAPMPVGDPDGSVEEIDITEIALELFETADPDRVEELSRTLAWAKSHHLDTIQTYCFLRNGLYNTEHWDWSEPEGEYDNLFNNQEFADLAAGSVQGRTQ